MAAVPPPVPPRPGAAAAAAAAEEAAEATAGRCPAVPCGGQEQQLEQQLEQQQQDGHAASKAAAAAGPASPCGGKEQQLLQLEFEQQQDDHVASAAGVCDGAGTAATVEVVLRAAAAGMGASGQGAKAVGGKSDKPGSSEQQSSLQHLEEAIRDREDLLFEEDHGPAGAAVPLAVRRKEVRLRLPLAALAQAEYFRKLLAEGGPWSATVAAGGAAVLEFPTLRMMDGFLTALQCMVSPREHPVESARLSIESTLQVHAAACMLGQEALAQRAEAFLGAHMSEALFFKAFTAAQRFDRPRLTRRLFRWLCYSGRLRPFVSDHRERRRSLCVSRDRKAVCCPGGKSLAAAQFWAAMRADLKDKGRFFCPGDPRGAAAPPPYVPRAPVAGAKSNDHSYTDVVQCYVERVRHAGPHSDETHLVVRAEASGEVLLAVCHVEGSSEFVFAAGYPSAFAKDQLDYVGALESSFTGQTFVSYDCGLRADDPAARLFPEMLQGEHAALVYDQNVMGRIPNALTAIVPDLSQGAAQALADGGGGQGGQGGGLVERYESGRTAGLLLLRTRKPDWNRATGSWTLDFHSRVVLASKKNFKIQDSTDERHGEWLMLFGKVSKHRFSLDFRPPLSIMQAACIAASAFCDKLMVT